jgi:hypothetical protein
MIQEHDVTHVFDFLQENVNKPARLIELQEDIGSGRVTQGMLFLEILSEAIKLGDEDFLTHLDDNVPFDLKKQLHDAETEEEKTDFILQCLSCKRFNYRLKEKYGDTYENNYLLFRKILADIYDDVVAGTFERKKYHRLMPYIKRLILIIKLEEE